MRIKDALSLNLRRLCQNEPSIAHVCRAIGVTRQQFNGYLSGKHFPNERILSRICAYFEIDETTLVAPVRENGEQAGETGSDLLSPAVFGKLLRHNASNVNLEDGIYAVYFSVPGEPAMAVRSTMIVKTIDGLRTFRRVTGYYRRSSSSWSYYRGDHVGLAVEAGRSVFLCSVNQKSIYEPSLIALDWTPSSEPVLSGKSLIVGLKGPAVAAVVAMPAEGAGLRDALRRQGSLRIDSGEVPQIVLHFLEEELSGLQESSIIRIAT
jgi:transcriptional regulator with XRE-family HTH domain